MSEPTRNRMTGEDGNYVVVARRYRPRGFDELVGQAHVGRALKNAIETGRVGHAYLFTGARGVGKTSTARIFAKALNDPAGPTATPDNSSDIAQAIDAGEDVDVIEIDGASNRGIDEIRSLRANVGVRPSRSRFKIYIIDEVHMLTQAAFNALLKTLEEPPEHVKFIFCTTDPEKIPITVLSRCQRFDFAPVEVSKIVQRLSEILAAENAEAEEAALELIARRAAGSMRDSQSLLEQVLSFSDGKLTADQVHAMLGTADDERLHSLAMAMSQRQAAEALRQMDAAVDAGVDAGRLAEQLLGFFRDLMAATVGCDATLMRHTSASMHEELKTLGEAWGLQTVLAVVGLLDQTLVRIRHSVHGRVLLESALIQICNLPDLQGLADLAAAAGEGGPAGEKKKLTNTPAATKPPSSRHSGEHEHEHAASMLRVDHPARSGDERASEENAQAAAASGAPRRTPASAPGATASAAPAPATTPATATAASASEVSGRPTAESASQSHEAVAEPVESAGASPWDQASAERIWKQVLGELESMTETFARAVQEVKVTGAGQLKLIFPADAAVHRQRCELPEHRGALTEAVSQLAGRKITLEFASAAPVKREAPKVETAQKKPSRQQRMREIEANALVKSCIELFEAEIVRIDRPR